MAASPSACTVVPAPRYRPTSSGLKDLDRCTGELLVLLAEHRRGPAEHGAGRRTTADVAFAYYRAIERAMAETGLVRLFWTTVARHHSETLRRAAAAVSCGGEGREQVVVTDAAS